jgi:hypothetical protein
VMTGAVGLASKAVSAVGPAISRQRWTVSAPRSQQFRPRVCRKRNRPLFLE